MPSPKNIHDSYLSGDQSVLDAASNLALQKAYFLAKKATAYQHVEKMEILDRLWRKLVNQPSSISDSELHDESIVVAMELSNCYDAEADDLILFAAFEQYFKSVLLKSGVIVHTIVPPVGKKQKDHPAEIQKKRRVTVSDVIKYEKTSKEVIKFKEHTIGASVLLEKDYLKAIQISNVELEGIYLMKMKRDRTHFDSQIRVSVSSGEGYGKPFYESIRYIKRVASIEHLQKKGKT